MQQRFLGYSSSCQQHRAKRLCEPKVLYLCSKCSDFFCEHPPPTHLLCKPLNSHQNCTRPKASDADEPHGLAVPQTVTKHPGLPDAPKAHRRLHAPFQRSSLLAPEHRGWMAALEPPHTCSTDGEQPPEELSALTALSCYRHVCLDGRTAAGRECAFSSRQMGQQGLSSIRGKASEVHRSR